MSQFTVGVTDSNLPPDVPLQFTGNTGTSVPVANNENIVTAGATVLFAGSGPTMTIDFSLGGSGNDLVLGSSLPSKISSTWNTGLGVNVLNSITTGGGNTIVGYLAGINLTTAGSNTGIGWFSLSSLTSGQANVAIGTGSLSSLVTGRNNIAIGQAAGISYSSSETGNIAINNEGVPGDTGVIRIGSQGVTIGQQNICYLAGALVTTSGRIVNLTSPAAYPYTVLKTDYIILVDTTTGRTINLIASPVAGMTYEIKDSTGSASVNNITIIPTASTIDGAASISINQNYGAIKVVYNGTQWGAY